jgi:cytochrome d ubiquinol oxidase subunit II
MDAHLPIILPVAWAAILAFSVFLYVMLDGFDLGLGALFPFAPSDEARDRMMQSVAPVWDGNETWLVMGGIALLSAFPMAYAIVLPALYLPVILMLIGLILRGVAFEFRFRANRSRFLWDAAFCGGSVCAAVMQGISLGAFIQGFAVAGRAYAGGPFDWLTPFCLFTGLALLAGYVLLAAGWLIIKAEGTLQDWAYAVAGKALVAVAGAILIVSLWTPLQHPAIAARWFAPANLIMFSPVPVITALCVIALWRSLKARAQYLPFLLALALFVLSYTGLAVSLFPYIVPPAITIWDAAAAPDSQLFLLYGVVPLLPIILAYTAYNYWVFRGKTSEHGGYH